MMISQNKLLDKIKSLIDIGTRVEIKLTRKSRWKNGNATLVD